MYMFLYPLTIFKILVVIKVWSKFLEGYVKIKHWFLFQKLSFVSNNGFCLCLWSYCFHAVTDSSAQKWWMVRTVHKTTKELTDNTQTQLLEVKPEVYRDRDRKWQALTNSILACKPQKKGKRVLLGWKRSSKNKNQSGCCILTTILKKNRGVADTHAWEKRNITRKDQKKGKGKFP